MRRIIIFGIAIAMLLAGGVAWVFAQALTSPYGNPQWLDKPTMLWANAGSETEDTLTVTGTEVYSQSFWIGDGHFVLAYKPKYTSTGADTDSVKTKLYRAVFPNASTLKWKLVDSTMDGGRADTASNHQWIPALAGKGSARTWWRFGWVKMMGVPKLVGIAKSSD